MKYLTIPMGIISLILMISSLFLPWYQIVTRDGPDSHNTTTTHETRYYFTGLTDNYPDGGNANLQQWSGIQRMDNTARLFSYSLILDIIGILLVAIFIVGMLAATRKERREIAIVLGVAATIFCLFVPLFFMQELPVATSTDVQSKALPFWNTQDSPDIEFGAPGNVHHRITTWSPDIGWYLPIISAFLGLSAAMVMATERPRPSRQKYVKPFVGTLIILLLLIPSTVALYSQPRPAQSDYIGYYGLRVDTNGTSDWLITITGGSGPASVLILDTVNGSTGETYIHAPINKGTSGNMNFTWNDANGNKKLDAGDSILLKGTVNGQPNPNVLAGFKVIILYKNSIIATISVLPSH